MNPDNKLPKAWIFLFPVSLNDRVLLLSVLPGSVFKQDQKQKTTIFF